MMNQQVEGDYPEYFVVVDERGVYALWPREATIPRMWRPIGPPRGRLAAFGWIAANWDVCASTVTSKGSRLISGHPHNGVIAEQGRRTRTEPRCGNCRHYEPSAGRDDAANIGFCNSDDTKDDGGRWVIGFVKAEAESCPFYQPQDSLSEDEET
jgi:uncharacterized protein YbdZ (MbtH family)